MDPFGNFGWNFGFGFGWILIGISAVLLIAAIVQLVRFGFKDETARARERERFDSLKDAVCANRIGIEEFEEQMHGRA